MGLIKEELLDYELILKMANTKNGVLSTNLFNKNLTIMYKESTIRYYRGNKDEEGLTVQLCITLQSCGGHYTKHTEEG